MPELSEKGTLEGGSDDIDALILEDSAFRNISENGTFGGFTGSFTAPALGGGDELGGGGTSSSSIRTK